MPYGPGSRVRVKQDPAFQSMSTKGAQSLRHILTIFSKNINRAVLSLADISQLFGVTNIRVYRIADMTQEF